MKTIGKLRNLLMTLYLYYTEFKKKKKTSQRVSELLSGHVLKFTNGHNSIKMWMV